MSVCLTIHPGRFTAYSIEYTERERVDEWQGEYLKAFEKLKDAVAGATELHLPDMDAERVLISGIGQSTALGDAVDSIHTPRVQLNCD